MNQDWDQGRILEVSGGYWLGSALHTGVKTDVFSLLDGLQLTGEEVAARAGCDPRGMTMLLNALTAVGLLEKSADTFRNTPAAATWLSRNSDRFLGHILLHHHHLMEPWARLDLAVKNGRPLREKSSHSEEEWREQFLMGMFNLASRVAPELVGQIDVAGRRRLLDLGGGPGTYAVHFCRQNPELEATVFDLPASRTIAERTIARFGLQDRVSFLGGDFLQDSIPGSFDVAWLSHILHGEGPEGCARILERAVSTLGPGGLILIHEFILEDNMAAPAFPALFSLNMLLNTEAGQSYSQAQITGMLQAAGVREVRRLSLDLPGESGVIAGVVG